MIGIQGSRGPTAEFVNYRLYGALGADYAVRVRRSDPATLQVTAYDVRGRTMRRNLTVPFAALSDPDSRMRVHRLSDDVVQAATGARGIAATRLVFLQGTRVYRLDSDGAAPAAGSPGPLARKTRSGSSASTSAATASSRPPASPAMPGCSRATGARSRPRTATSAR